MTDIDNKNGIEDTLGNLFIAHTIMSSDSSPSLEQMRSHRSILLSSHDIVDQVKNPQSIHGTFSHLLQRSRNAIFKQKIRCDGRLTLSGRVESTENDVHDRSLSTAPWGVGTTTYVMSRMAVNATPL